MPTYDYECSECGNTFEYYHKGILDDPLQECPKCKGIVKRLPGRGSYINFVGSGFYENDYKRKKC